MTTTQALRDFEIKQATSNDIPIILSFIKELAATNVCHIQSQQRRKTSVSHFLETTGWLRS